MPAVDPDPDGELPTNPVPSRTPTERPPREWSEPLVTYDRELGSWVLAADYEAVQHDRYGNSFVVPCEAGLRLRLTVPGELRADVVSARLSHSFDGVVSVPFNGGLGYYVGAHWAHIIEQAFRDGDRGRLLRG